MAHTLTTKDAAALMNLLVKQATGQTTLTSTSTADFVSVGETVLATGTENTLNALSIVLGQTLMAVRPYKAKLAIVQALNSGMYTNRLRKISFYTKDALNAGDQNTNLFTNLADGYDNGGNGGSSVASMWQQNAPIPLELNFSGRSAWDDTMTVYEYQLKQAFRSEDEFIKFVSGIITEKEKEIELQKEQFRRMVVLNHIAGVYDLTASMPNSLVDLRAAFNTEFGTSYTRAQILESHMDDFAKFLAMRIKQDMDYLEEETIDYHWTPTKVIDGVNYYITRHTDKADQRLMLYQPLVNKIGPRVLSDLYQPGYLTLPQYEGVNYWQKNKSPEINVTPAIPDVSDPSVQTTGTAVNLDYVVGILYDKDAMMVDFQYEGSATTPLEARKMYRNTVWHFSKNAISDFTENAIVYYMSAGA